MILFYRWLYPCENISKYVIFKFSQYDLQSGFLNKRYVMLVLSFSRLPVAKTQFFLAWRNIHLNDFHWHHRLDCTFANQPHYHEVCDFQRLYCFCLSFRQQMNWFIPKWFSAYFQISAARIQLPLFKKKKKKTLISLSSKTSPFHHKRSHILVSRIAGHNEVNSGQRSLNMFPHVSQIVNIAFWNEIVKWNSCLKRFVLNFAFKTFLSLTKL